jgi:anti-sigma factor (TIGR02949 family)
MNCALALRMLNAYVDDEVDAATAAEMAEHLAGCSACRRVHEQRLALRQALRTHLPRETAPPDLRKGILRALDALGHPTRPARASRWWQTALVGASTAIAGALGGWWLAQPQSFESLPQYAVAQHVAALSPEGPRIDIASSDRHVVRPWFQGRLEFAPMVKDLSAQGFDLVGARLDRLGDRQAVAVVYRLRRHVVDVFSWRGTPAHPAPEGESVIRGFNVVTWSDGDLDFAVVSDADRTELDRFTAAYRAR